MGDWIAYLLKRLMQGKKRRAVLLTTVLISLLGTSVPAIAATPPMPVRAITVGEKTTTGVALTWTAPSNDGGSPITDFKIEYSSNAGGSYSLFADGVSTAANAVITGLTTGQTYIFRIRAVTSVGQSNAAISSSVLVATKPGQVSNFTITSATSSSIDLSWDLPNSNGAPLLNYFVYYKLDSDLDWQISDSIPASTVSTSVELLSSQVNYLFRIVAVNIEGTGPFSEQIQGTTFDLPNAPTSIQIISHSSSTLGITWTPGETDSNLASITGFHIQYRSHEPFNVSPNVWTDFGNVAPDVQAAQIDNLITGTTYEIRVGAISSSGIAWEKPIESTVGQDLVCSTFNSGYVRCWNKLSGSLIGETYFPGLSRLSIGTSLVCGIDLTSAIVCGNGITWIKNATYTNVKRVTVVGGVICVVTATWGPRNGACLYGDGSTSVYDYVLDLWVAENNTRNTGSVYTMGYSYTCFVNKDDTAQCRGAIGGGWYPNFVRPIDWIKSLPSLEFPPVPETCANQTGDYLDCSGYFLSHPFELVRGLPKAPGQISVENLSKTSVGINWAAPEGNGSAVTSQLLDYSNDYGATWMRLATLSGSATSHLAQSLATEDYLMFRVAGVNVDGAGEFRTSNATPIGTVSSLVQNVSATVLSENSLDVEWTPPLDDGAFAINSYKVAFRKFGTSNWIDYATVPSDQNSVVVTGLEKGTKYEIRVNSVNAVGVSDSMSITETPSIPPSTPALDTPIVVDRNTVTIPFTVDDDGGMPITELTVRSRIVGTNTWKTENEFVSNVGSVTIDGLPVGENIEFQLSATNIRGSSEYSSNSDQVLLAEQPGPPTQLSVTVRGGQELQVDWAIPTDDGGSFLTGYEISIKLNESSEWLTAVSVSSVSLSHSFTELIRGETYEIRVRSFNAAGKSDWSLSSGIPSTAPSSPSAVTASISSRAAIKVTWTESTDNGGQAIAGHLVRYSSNSGQTWSEPIPADASANSLMVYGLTNGLSYKFSVVAVNPVGESLASASSLIPLVFNISQPVRSVKISGRTKNSLTVSWTAPLPDQGVSITGFQTQTKLQGQPWRDNVLVGSTKAIATLTGLVTGAKYEIRVVPVTAQGRTPLHNEVQVSAAFEFTCAVLTDSSATAKCWGSNEKGQLGNGGLADSVLPVEVKNLVNVKEVAAGYFHACALTFTGEVYCWGSNESGQLGDESISLNSRIPVKIQGLGNITQLTAGGLFNCATTESGEVFCWGDNSDQQVSINDDEIIFTPTVLPFDDFFTQVSAGIQHACGVTKTKLVRCWGDNAHGQWGANTDYPIRWDLPITWDTNYVYNGYMGLVKAVEAGHGYTCATSMTDELWCWGEGDSGQLGGGQTSFNGNYNYSDDPVYISGSSAEVYSFTAGQSHTCFVSESTDAYCWGWNRHGQVGDPDQSRDPWTYTDFADVKNLTGLRSISAGGAHTCASSVNDIVYCWGANSRGQTGQSLTRTIVETPGVPVDLGIWSPLAVPAAAPGAPATAKLVSSASKTALWTIGSAVANGSTVIRYEQRTSVDNGKRWTTWKTIKTGTKTTGWVKGKPYLVQIRAVNEIGAGVAKQIVFKPTK